MTRLRSETRERRFDSHLTEGGIPGIRHIPFGVHLCHFYSQRQDLVDILIPYFCYGLRNHERCVWLTSPAFCAEEAGAELARCLPEYAQCRDSGRLRIIEGENWFASLRGAREDALRWLREEEDALAAGYAGLRIAGNMDCDAAGCWGAWMGYEDAASAAFEGRRIVALCGYDSRRCQSNQVCDVISSHHHTLYRTDGAWQVAP